MAELGFEYRSLSARVCGFGSFLLLCTTWAPPLTGAWQREGEFLTPSTASRTIFQCKNSEATQWWDGEREVGFLLLGLIVCRPQFDERNRTGNAHTRATWRLALTFRPQSLLASQLSRVPSSSFGATQEADTHFAQLKEVEMGWGRVTSLKGIRNLRGKFNHCSTDLDFHNSPPLPPPPARAAGVCV